MGIDYMKAKVLMRERFREAVFARDNHTCRTCSDKVGPMDAHHITDRNEMPNGGYVKENGITLCPKCHVKAEEYHKSNGLNWIEGFHPNDLYKLIASSYARAVAACLNAMK